MKKKNKFLFTLMPITGLLSPFILGVSMNLNDSEQKNNKENKTLNIYEFLSKLKNYTTESFSEHSTKEDKMVTDFVESLPKREVFRLYTNVFVDDNLDNNLKIEKYSKENKKVLDLFLSDLKDKNIVKYSYYSEILPMISVEVDLEDANKFAEFLDNKKEFANYSKEQIVATLSFKDVTERLITKYCIDKPDDLGKCLLYDQDTGKASTSSSNYNPYSSNDWTYRQHKNSYSSSSSSSSTVTKKEEPKKKEESWYYLSTSDYKTHFRKQLDLINDDYDETKVKIDKKTNEPEGVYRTKVGVWEQNFISPIGNYFKFNNIYSEDFAENEETFKKHKQGVAMLISGQEGVDSFSKIFDQSIVWEDSYIQDKDFAFSFNNWKNIEKVIKFFIKNKINLVNGSFGYGSPKISDIDSQKTNYDNLAYFLDLITRKYKIIFVFSAGNHKLNKVNNNFHGMKLGLNTIKVAALDTNNKTTTNFSVNKSDSYYFLSDYPNITVAAPGTNYDFSFLQKKQTNLEGTSFAAPLVTGVISKLYRNFPKVRNKPVSIFSLIGVSSDLFNEFSKNLIKGTGYNQDFGAGILNYKKAKEAVDSLKEFTIKGNREKGKLDETVKELELKDDSILKISSAWLFNGFDKEIPENIYLGKKDKNYFEQEFKNNNVVTDFNIILEYWNSQTKEWEKVKETTSVKSNKEILNIKISKAGKYRYYLYKQNSSISQLDDEVAISHLVE
ncbi:S8 family serine peptidase [Mycoplasma sp. AC157]